jgi:hypothetical protein
MADFFVKGQPSRQPQACSWDRATLGIWQSYKEAEDVSNLWTAAIDPRDYLLCDDRAYHHELVNQLSGFEPSPAIGDADLAESKPLIRAYIRTHPSYFA